MMKLKMAWVCGIPLFIVPTAFAALIRVALQNFHSHFVENITIVRRALAIKFKNINTETTEFRPQFTRSTAHSLLNGYLKKNLGHKSI